MAVQEWVTSQWAEKQFTERHMCDDEYKSVRKTFVLTDADASTPGVLCDCLVSALMHTMALARDASESNMARLGPTRRVVPPGSRERAAVGDKRRREKKIGSACVRGQKSDVKEGPRRVRG